MHACLEYISAGAIIFLIMGFTGQYTTAMVSDHISLIEKNAGVKKADSIIYTLLLSPGQPLDWGHATEEPELLGLALENAVKLYQLDKYKVRRLSDDSPNYISPGRIRDLLGLSAYYYIAIRIYPIFNITVTGIDEDWISIRLVNQWRTPVSNINITAAYLDTPVENVSYSDITSFMDLSFETDFAFNVTDALGTCTLNCAGVSEEGCLLILATQLGVKSLTTWPNLSEHVIGTIESTMGSVSGFNTEVVQKNVEIEDLDYIVRLTLWS